MVLDMAFGNILEVEVNALIVEGHSVFAPTGKSGTLEQAPNV